jgi:pimeloyl-ACP methyl ester carboxylesterase
MDADVVVRGWRRRLTVCRWGDLSGRPVFLLHGTPGSRLGTRPGDDELRELGVCLITYDRPGYGGSDPHPNRKVADAAGDVAAIADWYGYERFAVLGRSGGGPHALACAALRPERVSRAATLVSLAPYGVPGLDWQDGMVESNRVEFAAALAGRAALAELLYSAVLATRSDPERYVAMLERDATPGDRRVLADPQERETLARNFAEAVRRSMSGWVGDVLAYTRPWGFDLSWIDVPTLLWGGRHDIHSPFQHSAWLAEQVPGAILRVGEDNAHFSAARVQLDAVRWLLDGTLPEQ